MAHTYSRIWELGLETQARISSSVQITSLHDVVLELVKNSLDADATQINVRLDLLKGFCAVLDNGIGISRSDFTQGRLAQHYHTSKDFNAENTYGRYGRFLASLSSVSILSITSQHKDSTSVNSTTLKDGKIVLKNIDMDDDVLGGSKHGTRVVVHNLFGRMPVRIRHRLRSLRNSSELEKSFHTIKKSLVELALATKNLYSLEMNETTYHYSHKVQSGTDLNLPLFQLNLKHIVSTLFQAGFLKSPDMDSWRLASLQSQTISVCAAINLEPVPTKNAQFVSLNQHPLPPYYSKLLCDKINTLFEASKFGMTHDTNVDHEGSMIDSSAVPRTEFGYNARRSVDRWPIFYIRISTDSSTKFFHEPTGSEADRFITSVDTILHTLITEFLYSSNLGRQCNSRENKPEIAQAITKLDSNAQAYRIAMWSRFRSSDGLEQDVLKGLPFITSNDSSSSQSQLINTRSENNQDGFGEPSLEWNHPRSGNVLRINARTGMAFPQHQPDLALSKTSNPSQHVPQKKTLSEVTSTLRAYSLGAGLGKTLQSVSNDIGNVHNLEGKKTTCALSNGSRGVKITDSSLTDISSVKLSKSDLKAAKVLGQVDGKYILASLVTGDDLRVTLLVIDQHAADERVQVEGLFQDLCNNEPVRLISPILFEVNQPEADRFQSLQARFALWGIKYRLFNNQVWVHSLPDVIAERCRLMPGLLIELMRADVWREDATPHRVNDGHWLSQISACPPGILEMLASRACRSAVMFNDELTVNECQNMVSRLSQCSFPFQCAHGRPTMMVLARIQDLDLDGTNNVEDSSFKDKWKAWD